MSVVRPDGSVQPSRPGNFGAITNAHHLKLGGPWDTTFEPQFNQVDGEIRDLMRWIYSLDAHSHTSGPMLHRILAQPFPDHQQQQLARTTASLIARSPRTRNGIKLTTEYFQDRMGFAQPDANKTLIAVNQRGLYDAYRRRLGMGGRWAVLFTDTAEFIFGDGFFHNFPASADGLGTSKKCVLPLTPTAAVVSMLPTSHPSEPKLVTLKLTKEEVSTFNEAVQVYSKEFLFFRSHAPTIDDGFSCGEFMEFKYHRHEWIDDLLDDLAQYKLWGPGGSPSRMPRDRSLIDLAGFFDRDA